MALSDMMEPFVWGQGGARLTPEQIARKREVAAALTKGDPAFSGQAGWAGILGRGLEGALAGYDERRANQAEAANASTNQSLVQALLGGGSEQFPAAPTSSASTAPEASYTPNGNEVRDGIISTASALGIDPTDLATAISYETAGTFDPTKGGPTTQWGQHRGLIQFGEPQAAKYGVDWANPVSSQLGENGAVAKYLRDAGVQPGMGMLDIYSAINAGRVGRYNASDANNGGAPGTVRDKVEQQMAGHRKKALALLGDAGQAPAVAAVNALAGARPTQVASLDPSIVSDLVQRPGVTADAQPIPNSPSSLAADPRVIQDMPVAGAPANQQIAQALTGPDLSRIPVTAGGNAGVYQPGQGGNMQAIVQALSSPYADEQTKKIAGMLLGNQLQQQQQANDPLRQLQIQKMQQDLSQGKLINAGNGFLYNPTSQEWITAPGANQEPDSIKALRIRAQEAGLQPGTPEYQQLMASGGKGPLVNVNTGSNTSKFVEKSDEAAAKRMDDIVTAGQTAPQTMADMQQLLDLGASIGTGKAAQAKAVLGPYAQALGIDINGMGDIQAYQAITSRLAPQMRAVGSGSSSDRDVALFFQSLPGLGNTPGGNEIIANTMKAVAQNKINAADIASRAQRGEISWQDADKQIRELPNPYDLFKQFQKEAQDKKKTVIDGYTIEEVQ